MSAKLRLICCVLNVYLVVVVVHGAEDEKNPYVRIHQGLLRGKWMTSRSGRTFMAFLMLPYAEPPVGDLRFEPPQNPSDWDGVRDATEDGVICTQRNVYVASRFFLTGQEDCLYLNVYTPKVNTTSKDELLPVMVFLHGGGWVTGSGNSHYYPPDYLLDKDIVFVSIDYRLGPLGFLSMEDEDLPGNMGLKDQTQALKWVQRNVKFFGGNPDLVTIFGESAGGSSVHYHMLSPGSEGLFHRGISQSGTAMCSWSLAQPGVNRNNTVKLAKVLGCPTAPTTALVSCLKKKTAGEIITTDVEFMVWNKEPMIPFKPVVEAKADPTVAFLPEHPEEIIRSGRVANVPWMTGVNSEDGALGVASFFENDKLVEQFDKNFDDFVPMIFFLHRETGIDVREASRQIRRFYLGERALNRSAKSNIVDLYTDGWFLAGTDEAVRLMHRHTDIPIYYYYFSYRGSISFSYVFGNTTQDYGVCHADELIYLFPMGRLFPHVKYTEKDEAYMKIFLELWTNFAITGDPTPVENDIVRRKWEPVSSENFEYYHLAEKDVTMEKNLLPQRTAFWSLLKIGGKGTLRDEL